MRHAPLLLAALELSFDHPASAERVTFALPEPARFRAFELLPGWPPEEEVASGLDESSRRLLAAVVRAGQRQSPRWKDLWAAHCTAAARDGAVPFADDGGSVGERNPEKRTSAFLRSFLAGMRADFGDALWVPADLWASICTREASPAARSECARV